MWFSSSVLLWVSVAGLLGMAEKPLPDSKTLIATALHNQEIFAIKRSNYVCTYTSNLLYIPKQTSRYEVLFINGNEIIRLLSENGKPLTIEQAAGQEMRVDQQVEAAVKDPPPATISMDGGWTFFHSPHSFSQTVEGAIMRQSIFDSETRVTYRNRPAIQMNFHADKHAHAITDEERAAQAFDGYIIIDEADKAVVRIGGAAERDVWKGQIHLVEHSHILGFDEKRIDDGFYLPFAWTSAPPWPSSYNQTRDFWLEGCRKYRVDSYIVP